MTSKTAELDYNEFQQNNIALMSAGTLTKLKSGDWSRTPAPLMQCVVCGGKLTTFVMKYFNWDSVKFKCYKCQDKANK